jgi:hypothetical protein
MDDQFANVRAALAQGRQADRNHVEPVEQVLTKSSPRHRMFKVTVGRLKWIRNLGQVFKWDTV